MIPYISYELSAAICKRGSIPLIEIAAACGFSSHAHLSRSFRKAVGVAPNQYRRVPDRFM